MTVIKNDLFFKVYDKVLNKLDHKVKIYANKKRYGSQINHKEIMLLNMIIKYMENINNSPYEYFYVDSLTEISNYLNKI